MKTLTVTGASDDLIELEGCIREEWNAVDTSADEPELLACSDGTLLRVWYDQDGIWRIIVVATGEGSSIDHVRGDVTKDTFDRVTLRAPELAWVVRGSELAR